MKAELTIQKIETIRVPEHPNVLWVQVHADNGLIGLGETFYLPGAVEAVEEAGRAASAAGCGTTTSAAESAICG